MGRSEKQPTRTTNPHLSTPTLGQGKAIWLSAICAGEPAVSTAWVTCRRRANPSANCPACGRVPANARLQGHRIQDFCAAKDFDMG